MLCNFLSRYSLNTVPNLSLVFSGIYDVLKRTLHYEHFQSFQLNIQLEKGYHGKTKLILRSRKKKLKH